MQAFDPGEGQPLADRLRPTCLADFAGQQHLLGPDTALARLVAQGRIHSMILWRPPGSGKTTLARLLAQGAGMQMLSLSAWDAYERLGSPEGELAIAEASAR